MSVTDLTAHLEHLELLPARALLTTLGGGSYSSASVISPPNWACGRFSRTACCTQA